MSLSNCLLFACWRWMTRGGYLIIRRSHYGCWPHVLWSADLRDAALEHYVPVVYASHCAVFWKLLFHGYISRADTPRVIAARKEGPR